MVSFMEALNSRREVWVGMEADDMFDFFTLILRCQCNIQEILAGRLIH